MYNFNNIKRVLAVLVIAAATYLTVLIALKVHRVKEPNDILAALPKNIDLSLRKVRYSNSKDGTLQWDLEANKVDYYNDPGIIRFSAAQMVFNNPGAKGKYTLKADVADYHKNSGDVRLTGNVNAANESGMTFTTGHVEYNAKKSLIVTNDHVRLSDGNFSVEGKGMEIGVNAKKVRVVSNVTAIVGNRKK